MAVRRPAVAGTFYAATPSSLKQQIIDSFNHKLGPGKLPGEKVDSCVSAIIAPHAGYVYSGPSAAHAYLRLAEQEKPDTVVVIGPNHTGRGTPVSIMGEGYWETPFGNVELDSEVAEAIIQGSNIARLDDTAFIREHSVEVQVPFLQYIYPEFKLVPICMGYQDLETSIDLGRAIYAAIKGRDALIVASSDLNHMEPKAVSNKKDKYVLDALEAMDEVQLQESVKRERITTCGYGPISATLVASKLGGAKSAEVLSYYTSGDIIGDDHSVVGYASAIISREEK